MSHARLLTELVRGRPKLAGLLRDNLIPGLTKFGLSAHAVVALLTGLDSDVRLHRAAWKWENWMANHKRTPLFSRTSRSHGRTSLAGG
ncbi:hypothetical protein OKW34_005103 [Paraburkholderia youngii]|uniref:hypothetical protein n=1 Tax=Paraburkholderia youngii TaxID=2782701 RepID=UPI003D2094B6